MRYSMVTVCCSRDREKMLLQARSIARYVPSELVDDIHVIFNESGADYAYCQAMVGVLRDAYGAHDVTFSPADFLLEPGEADAGGWWSQQALKLKAASLVSNERFIILDAKNHFTAPLTLNKLENDSGLPRTGCHDYRGHNMGGFTERSLRFFGLDPAEHVGMFLQTVTPFVAYRDYALETCRLAKRRWLLESESSASLAQIFSQARITEFMCYGACIVACGKRIEELYEPHQPGCRTLWASEVPKLEEILAQAGLAFAIHTEAWKLLSYAQKERIAAFWLERGLVQTFGAGMAVLWTCGAEASP